MRWKDVNLNPEVHVLRQFGGICTLFFGGMAIWRFVALGRPIDATLLALVSIVCAILTLTRPNWLRALFVASIVATFPIGWVISNAVLLLLYFGLMTPLALAFRWSGRDQLNLNPAQDDETFWSPKTSERDKRTYFKQF
jgi:hypothetical protein